MKMSDVLSVKVMKNLKMGAVRITAGRIIDTSDVMPSWVRKELEFGLDTVTVIERKKPAAKKIPVTKKTPRSTSKKKKTDSDTDGDDAA